MVFDEVKWFFWVDLLFHFCQFQIVLNWQIGRAQRTKSQIVFFQFFFFFFFKLSTFIFAENCFSVKRSRFTICDTFIETFKPTFIQSYLTGHFIKTFQTDISYRRFKQIFQTDISFIHLSLHSPRLIIMSFHSDIFNWSFRKDLYNWTFHKDLFNWTFHLDLFNWTFHKDISFRPFQQDISFRPFQQDISNRYFKQTFHSDI